MIPKSLWAQMLLTLELSKYFPKHSHSTSVDWSGGASSNILMLCCNLHHNSLCWFLYTSFPPLVDWLIHWLRPLHALSSFSCPWPSTRHHYNISVWDLEAGMEEERFTIRFTSAPFLVNYMLLFGVSSECLFLWINMQVLISHFV